MIDDWKPIPERGVIRLRRPPAPGRNAAVWPLHEGERGSGAHAGTPGTAMFPGGMYPACSRHGAMNRLGRDKSIWRCLATGCNVGLELTHV